MNECINILSTRAISAEIISAALSNHIHIECRDFIKIIPVLSDENKENILQIAKQPEVVVFTSMNAVDIIQAQVPEKVSWKIYCVGDTTAEKITSWQGAESIIAMADNAGLLAEKIIEDQRSEVWFFCGDRRRDELPEKLKNAGINLHEIVVYETINKSEEIEVENYAGILFFSPSAVESYFENNISQPGQVFFAIGKTTAATLETFTSERIITGQFTGKDSLALEAVNYFTEVKENNNE
ncbi:MAG: uroporphyrinogen-III synthase [Ferruginibacter sp.]